MCAKHVTLFLVFMLALIGRSVLKHEEGAVVSISCNNRQLM